jgi:hypothetical protein
VTVLLEAQWDFSDECTSTARDVTVDECNIMLSAALNDCDTDMIQTKYGGWKTNNCVIWIVEIISNNNVPQTAPQSPPVSNRFPP